LAAARALLTKEGTISEHPYIYIWDQAQLPAGGSCGNIDYLDGQVLNNQGFGITRPWKYYWLEVSSPSY